jgi:hypothetical protein
MWWNAFHKVRFIIGRLGDELFLPLTELGSYQIRLLLSKRTFIDDAIGPFTQYGFKVSRVVTDFLPWHAEKQKDMRLIIQQANC